MEDGGFLGSEEISDNKCGNTSVASVVTKGTKQEKLSVERKTCGLKEQ